MTTDDTNVILFPNRITEQVHASRKPQRTAGSNLVWGMLGSALGAIDPGNKERLEREAKSAKLQANLVHAITELAVHDGPLAMIDFAFPKIKAYRTGSCSNE